MLSGNAVRHGPGAFGTAEPTHGRRAGHSRSAASVAWNSAFVRAAFTLGTVDQHAIPVDGPGSDPRVVVLQKAPHLA